MTATKTSTTTRRPPEVLTSAKVALNSLADNLSAADGVAFKDADLKSIDGYEFSPGNSRKVLVWCHRHDFDDALHFCTNGCRALGRSDQVTEVAGIVLRILRALAA
ncbi:hypothetical protein [Actinomadura sp. 6N118]|uniref:hypothetical protein n=1 Tax=Actinomadura sp. 6N118 TaxID=3375151 RepID=UPI00379A70A4